MAKGFVVYYSKLPRGSFAYISVYTILKGSAGWLQCYMGRSNSFSRQTSWKINVFGWAREVELFNDPYIQNSEKLVYIPVQTQTHTI